MLNRCLLLLIGLTLSLNVYGERLDPGGVLKDTKLSSSQKVDALLKISDRLFVLYSFMYAHEVLTEVIKLDPENIKARSLLAITTPMMKLKGFYYRDTFRIKQTSPEHQLDFQSSVDRIYKRGPYYRFLFDRSQPQLVTEADYQKLLMEMNKDTIQSRRTFKALRKEQFKMDVIQVDLPRALPVCTVDKLGPLLFEKPECPYETVRTVEFDRADMEHLLQLANMMDLFSVMADGWTLDGVLSITNLQTFKSAKVTDKVLYDYLRATPEFGLLKTTSQLKRALEIGADIIPTLRFLAVSGDQFCKESSFGAKKDYRNNRFFHGGDFCLYYGGPFSNNTYWFTPSRIARAFETMLTGQLYDLQVSRTDESNVVTSYKTKLDFGAPFLRPPVDLKPLLPVRFNVCGETTAYGDPTLGGLFPRADANQYFEFTHTFSEKCVSK